MVVKADKLAQTIIELQAIVATQPKTNERFQNVGRSLETTATLLNTGKLSLHIISSDFQVAQTLQRLLRTSPVLTEKYHITMAPVPQEWTAPVESEPSDVLLLPISPEQHHEFHLTASSLAIGRHPKCQVFIPDHYWLVSGHHADIQHVSHSEEWQLGDRSRNGTFVNGEPIQDWRILQDGDRVTLGNSFPSDTCPALIFQSSQLPISMPQVHEVLNCDVVCFVFEAGRSLSLDEQTLLKQVNTSPIIKWISICDASNCEQQDTSNSMEMTDVRSLLQSTPTISVEEWTLPLQSHSTQNQSEAVKKQIDKQLEKLIKSLESLVRRKPEDILAKRLAPQVTHYSRAIDTLLSLETKRQHIEQTWDELRLTSSLSSKPKTYLEARLKPIEDDLLACLQQTRERLPQAKARLLDDYLEHSILNQIQQFVQRLQPCIVQQQGKKFLQLKQLEPPVAIPLAKRTRIRRKFRLAAFQTRYRSQPLTAPSQPTTDVNTALLHFCRRELTQWADQEWERFLNGDRTVPTKGFTVLLEDLRSVLLSQEQALDHVCLQPISPNYAPIFDEAFAKPLDSTRYQEPHPFFYILKKVRNQWMQFLFLFSFLSVLGIAGRKQIMQYLTAPIATAFHNSPAIATIAATGVLWFVIKLVMQWYRDERDTEREDEAKKLRQGLTNYYQNLVKNRLAEKLVQTLQTALDQEEQKLQELLHPLKQHNEQTTPIHSTLTNRQRIEVSKTQSQPLSGIQEKLQRLKRSQRG